MNIEEQIRDQHEQRRLNIMKGIDNLEPDYIEKAFDGDLEKAKQYADNGFNRKMNRVGQTYGKDGQEDQPQENQQNNNEENTNQENSEGNQEGEKSGKFEAPKPEASGERVEYAEGQLMEFAQQADDASLQRFLDDAANSGDNSEYMQSQINIAQNELNKRNGGAEQQGQIGGEENQGGEMNGEEGEENSGELDYSNPEAVRSFLDSNPEAKAAIVNMMMDDVSLSAAQALRIHQASTTSGSEALQHVEAAKQTLDELHAKLSGGESNGENGEGSASAGNIQFGPLDKSDRLAFDAPEDAVIAHIGNDSALYTPSEGYVEIVYEDGNFKQFENVGSEEEAMKIIQENVTSEEAQENNAEMEENRNQNNNEDDNDNEENQEENDNEDEEDEDLKESNAWASELQKPTDKSKGMNMNQIDEKQAEHYRKYEAKKNKK